MGPVTLSDTARRDLRKIGPGADADLISAALQGLSDGSPDLDLQALAGHPGWLRLRAGDWRVVYRARERRRMLRRSTADEGGWVVAHIVNRRDAAG